MKTSILKTNIASKTVTVQFEYDGVVKVRDVNSVFINGKYSKKATEARIKEVALGELNKIDLGVMPLPIQEIVEIEQQEESTDGVAD